MCAFWFFISSREARLLTDLAKESSDSSNSQDIWDPEISAKAIDFPSDFALLMGLSQRVAPFLMEIAEWSSVRALYLSDTCSEMRLLQTAVSHDKAMHYNTVLKYSCPILVSFILFPDPLPVLIPMCTLSNFASCGYTAKWTWGLILL